MLFRSSFIVTLAGVLACLVAIVAAVNASAARADQITEAAGNLAVLDAVIAPAVRGAEAKVKLRLQNAAPTTVRVSVSGPNAERGRFEFFSGRQLKFVSNEISVGPDEELDFSSSHIVLRLGPISRNLNDGDSVELQLTVDEAADLFTILVPVHVHVPPQDEVAAGQ